MPDTIIIKQNVEMACGPLFHLLCIRLALDSLLGLLILFRIPAIFQWWVANKLDKYDTHVLTAVYFELIHHFTFESFHVLKLGVSHVYTGEVIYEREHLFFLKSMELANHKSFPANWN